MAVRDTALYALRENGFLHEGAHAAAGNHSSEIRDYITSHEADCADGAFAAEVAATGDLPYSIYCLGMPAARLIGWYDGYAVRAIDLQRRVIENGSASPEEVYEILQQDMLLADAETWADAAVAEHVVDYFDYDAFGMTRQDLVDVVSELFYERWHTEYVRELEKFAQEYGIKNREEQAEGTSERRRAHHRRESRRVR